MKYYYLLISIIVILLSSCAQDKIATHSPIKLPKAGKKYFVNMQYIPQAVARLQPRDDYSTGSSPLEIMPKTYTFVQCQNFAKHLKGSYIL
jgi:hypothetical protein